MQVLAPLAAAVLLLPLTGCCSLARLFCGPDRSAWVSVDFQTPELAVRTLLEALRRDQPEIVYLSLSNDFRDNLGLTSMTAQLAWQRIREQNPGLHLAGYAEVPTPSMLGPGRARVVLDVEGTTVDIELVREQRWQVRYRRPDGTAGENGAPIDTFVGYVEVEQIEDAPDDRSRVTLLPLVFLHEGLDGVPVEAIEFVGLERTWKVAALGTIEQ